MSRSSTPSQTPSKSTPSKGKGVGYFNHYPKNFLRPYGVADDAPSADTIFKRTNAINCEMLSRPCIHFSEISETISENVAVVGESHILSKKTHAHLDKVRELATTLSKFSLKTDDSAPSKNDAKNMLRAFIEESDTTDFMEAAFKVGGALFSMGCSYLITQAYLRQPDILAEKLSMAHGEDASFKASKKLTSFRDILLAGCKRSHESAASSSSAIRNLLAELSSSDDDEPPAKKQKRVSKRSSTLSSDDDHE